MTTDASMPASPFLRRAGSHFAKLAGLYALYVAWAFSHDYPASVSYLHRVALLFGGASFALALLVAPAAFAAAVNHFDLFGERAIETRKRDWIRLALLGLGACLLPEAGIPLSDYVLDIVAPDRVRGVGQPGADYASAQLLVPVAVGIFVMISGVAGAAVGYATEWWEPVRSHAARWLTFVGLAIVFWIPVSVVTDLVRFQGYPPVLTVVVPSLLPALATCLLVRSQRYGVLEVLGLDRRQADWLDVEALERVLDVVIHEDEEGRPTIEEALHDEAELETARFLRGLRRAMAPTFRVTEAEVEKIVAKVLAAAPAQAVPTLPSMSRASRLRDAALRLRDATLRSLPRIGEFGLSWMLLAAGLMLFGLLADVSPSPVAAVALGGLGVVVQDLLSRRSGRSVPAGLAPT